MGRGTELFDFLHRDKITADDAKFRYAYINPNDTVLRERRRQYRREMRKHKKEVENAGKATN